MLLLATLEIPPILTKVVAANTIFVDVVLPHGLYLIRIKLNIWKLNGMCGDKLQGYFNHSMSCTSETIGLAGDQPGVFDSEFGTPPRDGSTRAIRRS